MKKYLFYALMAVASVGWAQENQDTPVNWMSFEQAVEKSKTEKRMIFIDVYTDWCGWCKVMDKNTFSEANVAKLLNEKFYAVKLDAEQTKDVVFRGTTFKFIPSGNKGTHQLATALLKGEMSFPTVVFMDEDFTAPYPYPGYRKPEEFHQYLVYFAEGYFKKGEEGVKEFKKNYKSPYSPTGGSGPGSGN